MLVALDANIWISERMLRSALGAAFLYTLHQTKGKILFADVVEKEVIAGIVREGKKSVNQIENSFVTIQTLIGTRSDYTLPSESDFEQNIDWRLADLEDFLYRVTCNIDHYQSAINRVVNKQTPNSTREQYRDSLLWEVIVGYAESEDVHFITNDNDFFQDKSNDLAKELKNEIQECNYNICVYKKIDEFLDKFNKIITHPNYEELSELINEVLKPELKGQIYGSQWELGELKKYEIKAFLTEDHTNLSLTFTMNYSIFDVEQSNKKFEEAELTVKGDSVFNLTRKTISEVRLDNIGYYGLNGESIPGGIIYARGEAVLGIRSIPYKLRREI
jgi:PIN domain